MEIKLSELTLTEKESKFVRDRLSKLKYECYGNNDYVTKLRIAVYSVFPDRVLSVLERQKNSNPLPFFVINNLPIDDVIHGSPSFNETGEKYKSGTLSENIICGLASVIGEPYSINFEGRELVNNLTPQKDTKNDYTGLGSEVELDFHIENAALNFMKEGDFSPMGLMLLGIRKDPKNDGPRTFVADARLAIEQLDDEDIQVLRDRNFIIRLPIVGVKLLIQK